MALKQHDSVATGECGEKLFGVVGFRMKYTKIKIDHLATKCFKGVIKIGQLLEQIHSVRRRSRYLTQTIAFDTHSV